MTAMAVSNTIDYQSELQRDCRSPSGLLQVLVHVHHGYRTSPTAGARGQLGPATFGGYETHLLDAVTVIERGPNSADV